MNYTDAQVAEIRAAIAEARAVMRARAEFSPLQFALAFIAHGGVHVPGEPRGLAAETLASELIASLETGRLVRNDPHLAREVLRAHTEAQWAEAAESDSVVGFRLELSAAAQAHPICRGIAKVDRGLGAHVFRKAEIAVLPPACDGARFTAVREDEVEQ